jgi:L-threonylcarbamoyladenylate synthase
MKIYTQKDAQKVANAFLAHDVLAIPTDTVYGVGVVYGDLNDLSRLKHAKHRPETKPIPMMVASASQMKQIAKVDARTEKIIDAFLPGPLTLILPLREDVSKEYTNGKDTVAVRIPDAPFILNVIQRLNKPLLVSSANISGRPAAITFDQAKENLPNIDGIVQGQCQQGMASTIVDCTKEQLAILREGPISLSKLENVISD